MSGECRVLEIRRMGDPVLRETVRKLTREEILAEEMRGLICDIKWTLKEKDYGVGLSAIQVGRPVAVSVIGIKPTPTRPNLAVYDRVMINAEIVETYGVEREMWEGCCSVGGEAAESLLFAKVPRFRKVRVRFLDEEGVEHEEILENFVAHVAQHEIDHQNGILFVDRVVNTKSYMIGSEYYKMREKERKRKEENAD
jgi:peptide deformylase